MLQMAFSGITEHAATPWGRRPAAGGHGRKPSYAARDDTRMVCYTGFHKIFTSPVLILTIIRPWLGGKKRCSGRALRVARVALRCPAFVLCVPSG